MTKVHRVPSLAIGRFRRVGAACLLSSALFLGFGAVAQAETILVSNLPPTTGFSEFLDFAPGDSAAQAFTTGPARDFTSVTLQFSQNPANATVEICSDSSGPGTCYSLPDASQPDPTGHPEWWRFANGTGVWATFSAGTKYWVKVTNSGSGTLTWDCSNSNTLETGEGSLSATASFAYWDGGAWVVLDATVPSVLFTTGPTLLFAVSYNEITSVELYSLAATWSGDAALVTWKTASEQDNAGFNVWRSDSEGGEYSRLTESLIPAKGGASLGASYSFVDEGATPGGTYFYKLEDVDTAGVSVFHGPVQAVAATISLVAPGNRQFLTRDRARFAWSGETCERFQVQLSRTADFSSRTIALPGATAVGSTSSRWTTQSSSVPTLTEWQRMKRLAGDRGRLFWRVVGVDAAGNAVTSAAQALRIR